MKLKNKGYSVIWITGLSGSGKTTLANKIINELKNANINSVLLDGDELRNVIGSIDDIDNYNKGSRLRYALIYSKLAKLLSSQGLIVVVATISMFREVYKWNRDNIEGYFEIYIKASEGELINRDSKGIYTKYNNGKLKSVAGFDLIVEEPDNPDLILNKYSNYDFNINMILSKLSEGKNEN